MTTNPTSPPQSSEAPKPKGQLPRIAHPGKVSPLTMLAALVGIVGCGAAFMFWQQAKAATRRANEAVAAAEAAQATADRESQVVETLFHALGNVTPMDDADEPTARSVLRQVERELGSLEDPAIQQRIQLDVARGYKNLGRFADAAAAARMAVDLVSQVPKAESRDVLETRAELAFNQLLSGDIPEGTTLAEELLEEAEDTLESTDPLRLAIMNASANADFMRGDTNKGLTKAREVLSGREDTIERDDPNRLFALNTQVMVLTADGELTKAIPIAERLSRLWNRYNPNHIAALAAQSTLANLQSRQPGTDAKSIEAHAGIVDQMRSTLGENDPQTLRVTGNYLHALIESKQFDQVIELGEPAVAKCKEHLPAQSETTALNQNALALAYHFVGRSDEAIQHLREVLETTREQSGEDNLKTLEVASNLFKIEMAAGNVEEATTIGEEAVELLRAKMGPDDPGTQQVVAGLAELAYRKRQHRQAADLMAEHYQWRKQFSGAANAATIAAGVRLSDMLSHAGDLQQSAAIADEVSTKAVESLGPTNQVTLISQLTRARCLNVLGDHDQAKAIAKEALDNCIQTFGAENSLTCDARRCYAETLMASGEYVAAEAEARELFNTVKDAPFANTLRIGLAANMIGEAQLMQGNASVAQRLLTAIVAGLEDEHPDHTLTAATQVMLGSVLLQQQELEAAEEALLKGHDKLASMQDQLTLEDTRRLEMARAQLAKLYDAKGQPEEADKYRAK